MLPGVSCVRRVCADPFPEFCGDGTPGVPKGILVLHPLVFCVSIRGFHVSAVSIPGEPDSPCTISRHCRGTTLQASSGSQLHPYSQPVHGDSSAPRSTRSSSHLSEEFLKRQNPTCSLVFSSRVPSLMRGGCVLGFLFFFHKQQNASCRPMPAGQSDGSHLDYLLIEGSGVTMEGGCYTVLAPKSSGFPSFGEKINFVLLNSRSPKTFFTGLGKRPR